MQTAWPAKGLGLHGLELVQFDLPEETMGALYSPAAKSMLVASPVKGLGLRKVEVVQGELPG